MDNKPFVVDFSQIDKNDLSLVGGKGANLGEMVKLKMPIPPGFIVTAPAYFNFLTSNNLTKRIIDVVKTINFAKPDELNEASSQIKRIITSGQVPNEISQLIIKNYESLGGILGRHLLVAVRSSATAEDLPDASFAGQQETFLNVKGEANLVNKVRACWASLFTPRAIFYRQEKNYDHFKVGVAVVVQKMIQSDQSGVMFTINPVTNDKNELVIEAIDGLGELIVQGSVTPDHYVVSKNNQILTKQIHHQAIKLVKIGKLTKIVKINQLKQRKQKISDKVIIDLAKIGQKIHHYYFFPQDIEWAKKDNHLYILQTRPVTTLTENLKRKTKKKNEATVDLPLILTGEPASPGVASGYAKVIFSPAEINKINQGDILVAPKTTPDFVPAMKKASGIITDQGGPTSHAAIVSRELGISCIVGTQKATKIIKSNQVITLDGKTGNIYQGGLPAKVLDTFKNNASSFYQYKTATKLYVNLAEPDLAVNIARKNIDGVGLLRAEFIISETIKYHPKKLIADHKEKFFIDKLISGLVTIGEAFYPRPVIYRATDFKTNEYRNLVGGKSYEPFEQNPMLGFRGAFRYLNSKNVFELELKALKAVRSYYNLKNLHLMIPFVRTPQELMEIKKIISKNGLKRISSFQLWMMVEIPSNVILIEDFIKTGIDGVSIGSNDLTMLTLGIDRDNELLASVFDERNKAVYWSLEKVIKACHKNKISCSICGQAPSQYPDFVSNLVSWGITSISVSPDVIEKTRSLIYEAEKRRVKQ